jgi:hypothetical protein
VVLQARIEALCSRDEENSEWAFSLMLLRVVRKISADEWFANTRGSIYGRTLGQPPATEGVFRVALDRTWN